MTSSLLLLILEVIGILTTCLILSSPVGRKIIKNFSNAHYDNDLPSLIQTKRPLWIPICDVLFALLCTIILFPLILLITILLSIENKQFPISTKIYKGKGGKDIRIYRYIIDLSHTKKITNCTHIAGLHQLPMLLNIIRGDVSWFGARLIRSSKFEELSYEIQHKYNVLLAHSKPGLVDIGELVDVTKIQDCLPFDIYFVTHDSFLLRTRMMLGAMVLAFFSRKR